MKIEMHVCVDLNAKAHLLSGSIVSYMTCFSYLLSTRPRMPTDMAAFIIVSYSTSMLGFNS